MSILVTGATGTIGSLIVQRLANTGADVKALVRQPGKLGFPAGVTEVVGDLTDVSSLRAALSSVRTLFLLNAVTPDETTQALIALNLAREAGIGRVVYAINSNSPRTGGHRRDSKPCDPRITATNTLTLSSNRRIAPIGPKFLRCENIRAILSALSHTLRVPALGLPEHRKSLRPAIPLNAADVHPRSASVSLIFLEYRKWRRRVCEGQSIAPRRVANLCCPQIS